MARRQEPHAVTIPLGIRPIEWTSVGQIGVDDNVYIIYKSGEDGAVMILRSNQRPPAGWDYSNYATLQDLAEWHTYFEDDVEGITLSEAALNSEEV